MYICTSTHIHTQLPNIKGDIHELSKKLVVPHIFLGSQALSWLCHPTIPYPLLTPQDKGHPHGCWPLSTEIDKKSQQGFLGPVGCHLGVPLQHPSHTPLNSSLQDPLYMTVSWGVTWLTDAGKEKWEM